MNLTKLLLFSDYLNSDTFNLLFGKLKNALKIVFKWNKSLNIKSITINDKLLLKNGFLIVNWKIDNMLYLIINDEIRTSNRSGIAFHYDKIEQPLNIKVKGLFGSFENNYTINHTGEVKNTFKLTPEINSTKALPILLNIQTQISPVKFTFTLRNKGLKTKVFYKETKLDPINFKLNQFQLNLSSPVIPQNHE